LIDKLPAPIQNLLQIATPSGVINGAALVDVGSHRASRRRGGIGRRLDHPLHLGEPLIGIPLVSIVLNKKRDEHEGYCDADDHTYSLFEIHFLPATGCFHTLLLPRVTNHSAAGQLTSIRFSRSNLGV
jgi:hypothetical protein